MTVTLSLLEDLRFRAEDGEGHSFELDSRPEDGSLPAAFTPIVALLAAAGGCTAMDVVAILTRMRQRPQAYSVRVSGERAAEHPRFYTAITYEHDLTGEIDEDKARRAIELSMTRYCSVGATLRALAPVTCRYRISSREAEVSGELSFPATHRPL